MSISQHNRVNLSLQRPKLQSQTTTSQTSSEVHTVFQSPNQWHQFSQRQRRPTRLLLLKLTTTCLTSLRTLSASQLPKTTTQGTTTTTMATINNRPAISQNPLTQRPRPRLKQRKKRLQRKSSTNLKSTSDNRGRHRLRQLYLRSRKRRKVT